MMMVCKGLGARMVLEKLLRKEMMGLNPAKGEVFSRRKGMNCLEWSCCCWLLMSWR